jgi:catechol 2,3-dioxygenase-like lactoylglutathione lyase family enzyme
MLPLPVKKLGGKIGRGENMGYLKGILHTNLTIAPGPEAIEQARRFYVDLLGVGVLDRPPETDNGTPGFWLDCGNGQQIHISSEPNPDSYNRPSKRHTAFQVSNLDGLKADLLAAGAEVQIQDQQFSGMRRIFARDPWGNGLELVEIV